VEELAIGDHVVLSGNSCGHCTSCHSGRPVYCNDMLRLSWSEGRADGSSPVGQGGVQMSGVFFGQSSFATHVIALERTTVRVPQDVPMHLLGPLGCGMLTGAASLIEALKVNRGNALPFSAQAASGWRR
jgi:aryl-alcohol dehydrogenase